MGAYRYTTKIINGICQRVYRWYDVVGPAEIVKSVAAACVRGAVVGGIVAGAGAAGYHGTRRLMQYLDDRAYARANEIPGSPWNAYGPGFGSGLVYGGGGGTDLYDTGATGFGSGGGYGGGGYGYGSGRNGSSLQLDSSGFGPDFFERVLGPGVSGGSSPGQQTVTDTSLSPLGPGATTGETGNGTVGGDVPVNAPEPGTLAILGFALLALAFICKRIK